MPKHYEAFVEAHPGVKEWLRNRPEETQRKFASYLEDFCNTINIDPEEWRSLDKFDARDLAWKHVQSKVGDGHLGTARFVLTTLKSWYRNKDGVQLPFDSGRGGKHYLPTRTPKRSIEHIPSKAEMYQIVDMASSLRDKALLLFLFQSGVRVNVVEHITYGDVKDQLDEDVVTLKITPRLDYKLRGRNIPFYYTFINGEGAETLKRYCEVHHKDSAEDTPLFYTRSRKPVSKLWAWRIVKMCVERAGLDPKTIWAHTIRKAFRKIVRQAPVDDDTKEMMMGHIIPGSREAYFDRKDLNLIKNEYEKCSFTREIPQSEVELLRKKAESQNHVIHNLEARITNLENLLRKYMEKRSS